jgi:hypothetical protein
MIKPKNGLVYLPQDLAKEVLLVALEHLRDWPIKTAERFRNAIIGPMATLALNPVLGIEDESAVNYLKTAIGKTVAEGRMINFDFLPNQLLKEESTRSRHMFEAGELQHPYDYWVALSRWEGGSCGYYIAPHPYRPNQTLVVELYGVSFPHGVELIIIYDIVSIEVRGIDDTLIHPFDTTIQNSPKQLQERGANSLDPLVTMLRILADASIPIVDVPAPEKLNRKRITQGKPPIPPHMEVHTRDYVAQFKSARSPKGEYKGGHHASPISHWRRSHKRTLADGRIIPVRQTKVNWRASEELHRLFYRVPPKKD